ncbi:UTRA domain-containing protein [Micromonospora peucetia]|uniref:UTRA domain-containing protein n=1 Tax=Micromonospora peucetia TaxID=47871 RepID=A0ABZ1ENU5_9ACTN|nr:UTRA domain-containing protein [Micromonospora peucetia]MCX4390108.1 UTRA domain-containing protein [Micromonospora peucetia]WSA35889.1 UTRA domain-containing protein [Micromonospora peucetia]
MRSSGRLVTALRDEENIRLTRSDHTITAEAATETLAKELDVAVGAPLLVIDCQLYAAGPYAVATGRLVFRPDVLCLTASADPALSAPRQAGAFGLTALTPRPPGPPAEQPTRRQGE